MGTSALNPTTIIIFTLFMLLTLGITAWAMRKSHTKEDFFAAGRSITGWQNGLALAGDYMGAATLLGVVGLISLRGYDGLIYAVGGLVGWPVLVMLIAGPMRRLGSYTLADVVATRLAPRPIRCAISLATLILIPCYLVGQLVGAGGLVRLIFGLDDGVAIATVGAIMLIYVLFGGMLATTWVQIIKAILLLFAGAILFVLVCAQYGFNPLAPFRVAAEQYGNAVLAPGSLVSSPLEAVSLAMGLVFGLIGLPHVLMRFFTVPNARTARNSVLYATVLIGLFLLVTIVLGYGALSLVGREAIQKADPGGNMATLLLAWQLGGSPLLGFVGAVTFATILALVSGLAISASTTIAHDLWNGVIRRGTATEKEQITVARITVIAVCVVGVTLAIQFRHQNVIFLTGLTFAVAASANFPVLMLALFWRGLRTTGAVLSIVLGTVAALGLIYFSPSIQVDLLHTPDQVWFPLRNPGLLSIPVSFTVAVVGSWVEQALHGRLRPGEFQTAKVEA